MVNKHTHGPYNVGRKYAADVYQTNGDLLIARIMTVGICRNESVANARLIAAAPELLESLRDMLDGWKYIRQSHGDLYGVGWDRAQDKAEKAIAKATGAAT